MEDYLRFASLDQVCSELLAEEGHLPPNVSPQRAPYRAAVLATYVLLTRLSPLFPFNLLNYAYGITAVRARDYIVASWIGMLPATLIMACVYIEQEWLVVTVMAIAFFGKGIASLGWPIISDISPKQLVGLTGGVFNMFGNCAGIVTPIVIGYLVAATDSFDSALIFVGVHCLLTIFAYFVIVGPIRRLELQA